MEIRTRLPASGRVLMAGVRDVLQALAQAWAAELATRPLPPLYSSGVRYRPEPNLGQYECFDDPWTVYQRRHGDCDDLVAWRVAELLAAGERATVQVVRRGHKMHVRVRRANDQIEDPSKLLSR